MKNRLWITLAMAVLAMSCDAQIKNEPDVTQNQLNESEISSTNKVFEKVDDLPKFPGGTNALISFIQTNLKYPEEAKKHSTEGKVFVEFIVLKTGKVDSVKIIRGIGNGCDESALELMKKSPDWKPGKQNGKLVNVKMVVPISFKLS